MQRKRFISIKWGASSRWSFGPNSTWGSIETTTIWKTRPSLILNFEPSKMEVGLENALFYKTFEVVNDDYVEIVAEGTIY